MAVVLLLASLLLSNPSDDLARNGDGPAVTAQAAADELLENPTFADGATGWALRDAEARDDGGRDGKPSVVLHAVDAATNDARSHVGVSLEDPPHDRELAFRCAVKASRIVQRVQVNAFAYDANESLVGSWTKTVNARQGVWVDSETTYVLDATTKRFAVWVVNATDAEILVSDAHLVAGKPAVAQLRDLCGPGIIRATAQTSVRPQTTGESGWVTFPVPGLYREQVPLTFDVIVEPPEALKRWEISAREDGLNLLCEIEVAPPDSGAMVSWESLVLVPDRAPVELPRAEKPEVPAEAKRWLASTACVQSDDAGVRAKAEELARGADDVGSYVKRVLAFTSANAGDGSTRFDTLDAAKALKCGGSCTSRANLAAALLRAHGIPARTVAHLPTWSGPLYEHWLVEYWHPGAGWVWIESSLGNEQPSPASLVVINVANPEDEQLSFAGSMRHTGVALGAPDLAVHKHSGELLRAKPKSPDAMKGAGNLAVGALRLRDADPDVRRSIFEAARAAYPSLREGAAAGKANVERSRRIRAAIEARDVAALRVALTS